MNYGRHVFIVLEFPCAVFSDFGTDVKKTFSVSSFVKFSVSTFSHNGSRNLLSGSLFIICGFKKKLEKNYVLLFVAAFLTSGDNFITESGIRLYVF